MDILSGLLHGFSVILEPQNLLYCFLGCLIGTLIGVLPGVVKAFESSSEYETFEDPRYGRVERGGCLNVLTPKRPQVRGTDGMASSACQVDVARWVAADAPGRTAARRAAGVVS
jgi:hypothetical protein